MMDSKDPMTRQAAGRSLQSLYRSGRLTDRDKQQILHLRQALTALHTDTQGELHEDNPIGETRQSTHGPWAADCTHLDKTWTGHTDSGVKIDI